MCLFVGCEQLIGSVEKWRPFSAPTRTLGLGVISLSGACESIELLAHAQSDQALSPPAMLADPVSRESPFVALTSLALAPPHRPAALQADLYLPLLSSHSWIKRFSVLQELGDPDVAANLGGRGGIPRGHTVISEAYGSTGCVNASAWEDGGPEARLATAGDDTKCVQKGPYSRLSGGKVSPCATLTDLARAGSASGVQELKDSCAATEEKRKVPSWATV
jgi:hypothetical protein